MSGAHGPDDSGQSRHLQDGRPYDNRYAWAFELRGERIAVLREYLDSYYIVRLFAPT